MDSTPSDEATAWCLLLRAPGIGCQTLNPLLAGLPPRERAIIHMRFFENMTQSQIAEQVGVSQMHVSRLLAKSLAQMRTELVDAQQEA